MLQPISQLEAAMRDTLLTKATGSAFDDLCRLYGIPRISTFSESAWRAGMLATTLGARGTRSAVHAFVEGILRDYAEPFVATVDPAAPQRLDYVSGGGGAGFEARHVGRLLRIASSLGSRLYWTAGPTFVGAPGAPSAYLTLAPVRTGHFDGADWSVLGGVEQVEVSVLAFVWRTPTPGPGLVWPDACVYELLIGEGVAAAAPGTYMQTSGARTAGEPYGGIVLNGVTTPGALIPPAVEVEPNAQPGPPHPIYLTDGTIPEVSDILEVLLAAGVIPRVLAVDWRAGRI